MRFINLISDDNENVSLGRIAFWIVFGFVIYSFVAPIIGAEYKLPGHLMEVFWGLLGYNVFKKIPYFKGLEKKERTLNLPDTLKEIILTPEDTAEKEELNKTGV